jgi:hypothetical protein
LYDHLRHRSCPRYGIRAWLQNRELTVHVVVHQGVALVGFLQHGIIRFIDSIPIVNLFRKAKNIFDFKHGSVIQNRFAAHVSENLMLI